MILALLLSALAASPGACVAVDADRIQMRHLRGLLQADVDIADEVVFGSAPQPGVRRTVVAGELVRWAKAHGAVDPQAKDGCFEWTTRQLTEAELTEAMQAGLEPGIEMKLVEFSRFPVPVGKVSFERSALREPSPLLESHPVIWYGYVQYLPNRRFKIWGKVILSVLSTKVTAVSTLKAGEPIQADQINQEQVRRFPYSRQKALTTEDFIGRVARRGIRAGTVLSDTDVVADMDVKKGDVVVLEAKFGHGLLKTQAVAEAPARIGERVLLRNAESGKVMRATLVSAGRAVVIPGLMPVATKGPNR
ncbi:flagellar basal body P-ring formation chaperone FlgA [uncultured Paludibaculum sp.]|uniref:flagellar basal body P-ring formation chaperone FlgA n=1 Tax=uncultured Paludibaculum sp. TaxID=1765020 RepID=UPI002AAAB4DF|nr:flagellar basal body P-ring formation chaperone FlgA [uncultured Paludibaculum sp.]